MKLVKISLFALAMMVAGSISAVAQTAEEIVQKHIAAIGGAENWKKINSIKMSGSITAQGMEIPISLTTLNGKGMRMDMSIMGTSNYLIITDKEGWSYFPVQQQQKPEPMTADQVKQSQDQLDVQGELIDYATKGSKIAFVGKDDMEGTEVFKLRLTDKEGKEKTMFFDAENYYLLREIEKMKTDGKEVEATVSYSNYQKLPEGIMVPMTVESDMGPVTMKTIEINPSVDEKIFKPTN